MSHARCAADLDAAIAADTNATPGLLGAMLVSDRRPAITVPEFPPAVMVCPHGVRYWTYPDGARVAALRDLNYPPTTPEDGAP